MLKILFASAVVALGGDRLPSGTPASVGMSAERLSAIDRVVTRGIRAGGYPGAAVIVARKGVTVWERGFGTLGWGSGSGQVDPEHTIYDLASLTKVVATTTAIMILFDEGLIDLEAPVARYLPEFSGGHKDAITVRQLLTHHSGLPAGRDLWRLARTPEEARHLVIDAPLVCAPGSCFIYSDLGADLLAFIVERITGRGLDEYVQERVFTPLGMTQTFFRPADSLRSRIAPTALTPPRGYPIRGEVHDENAWRLGGVAGHAGLFSTATDLAVFAQMMLNGGAFNGVRIVSDTAVELFTRRHRGTRALGWDTADGRLGAGDYLGPNAYGHTGFTGTSLWIDPEREMFVILLTNRVHAPRAQRPAKVISDVRADLADAAALAIVDHPNGVLAMPVSFRADRADDWNRPIRRVKKKRSVKKKSATARSRGSRKSTKATPAKAQRNPSASASER